jgi:hypothetical protein
MLKHELQRFDALGRSQGDAAGRDAPALRQARRLPPPGKVTSADDSPHLAGKTNGKSAASVLTLGAGTVIKDYTGTNVLPPRVAWPV